MSILFWVQQIAFYQKYGFIIIKNVLPEAYVLKHRKAVVSAIKLAAKEGAESVDSFVYGINVWEASHAVTRFLLNTRAAHVAAQLMQVDAGKPDDDMCDGHTHICPR
jgi:hypothetical protein